MNKIKMNLKNYLIYSLILLFSGLSYASQPPAKFSVIDGDNASVATADLLVKANGSELGACSKSMQNCTIQISQDGCLIPQGSISITNNSHIYAQNINAFSDDINFMMYVAQNNGCPSLLPPGASCTISFTTNASVAFLASNVMVKGRNTNATFFNINAVRCTLSATVTPSGDGNETITPDLVQTVDYGATQAFTVMANTGYAISSSVGGSCPAGSWSGSTYTTGAITSNCTVSFSATIAHTVSPSGDGHETISPDTTQTVSEGSTQQFTVTANAGYTLSPTVGGTCPAGSWSGSIYTTGAITSNCTVSFSAIITHTVTPSGDGNETISPNTTQVVSEGATQQFTVTANTGYTLLSMVGGTCPAGSWSGSIYTTGTITSNCTVSFSASINTYTLTPSAGANGSISPATAQVVNYGSATTFTATSEAGYGVDQWLVDGSLVQTGGTTYQMTNVTANHTVEVTFGPVAFASSVSLLVLSVNCLPSSSCTTTKNAALTGNPRQITIQNTGSGSATNVSANISGLPSGTSITSNTCSGTLNGGDSCIITLTPGSVASSNSSSAACTSGTQPVAGTVTVTADGGLSTQVTAYVLGYGCQYQGGFIYSVNDTTANTGSIGGKVVSLVDQAEPLIGSGSQATSIIWSSNGSGKGTLDYSNDAIPGIDETSSSASGSPTYASFSSYFTSTYTNTPVQPSQAAFNACNGSTDGLCNTNNILAFYNTWVTNDNYSCDPVRGGTGKCTAVLAPPVTPLTDYAAGLCSGTINGYTGWYLPAICEMDAVDNTVTCPAGTQSMVGSLSFLIGNPGATTPSTSCTPPTGTNCLAGMYWSSTESSATPQVVSWGEYFVFSGGSYQTELYNDKFQLNGVRCTRALTF
jgi:hypothetical protein